MSYSSIIELLIQPKIRIPNSSEEDEAFTLIEVLIVIGIIAVLGAAVIIAVRPSDSFSSARDSERKEEVRRIHSAVGQWIVDGGSLASMTQGDGDPITECIYGTDDIVDGTTADGEVDLEGYLVEGGTDYIAALPRDPQIGAGNNTGYDICINEGRAVITADGVEVEGDTIAYPVSVALAAEDSSGGSFLGAMSKRNISGGPFAEGVHLQGDYNNSTQDDRLYASAGTTINSAFKENWDGNQGSIVMWVTPEWDGNDGDGATHTLWHNDNGQARLWENDGTLYFAMNSGAQATADVSAWSAGTTYNITIRWDVDNTLNGSAYLSISIDDSHTYGTATQPSAQASGLIGIGNTPNQYLHSADGVIEGLTIYRRVLYDGTNGIDVGNGDELAAIYNSGSGEDPTLTTGSWDVAFALPTNATEEELSTGTGEAWSHPHSSNLLYTDTSNTGGFMMNGTYTSDGWSDEGTPNAVAVLASTEKVYSGGYKVTSDAANEGIYYPLTVSAGDDWVIRALGNSDGTCDPRVVLYDETNTSEIGSVNGTTSSTRTDPDTYVFTGEAPSGSTELRVKLINTASTGACHWHQVELLDNLVTNPSIEDGASDPWIPTGWSNGSSSVETGESVQELSTIVSGSSSLKIDTNENEGITTNSLPSSDTAPFLNFGVWINSVSNTLVSVSQYDEQSAWTSGGSGSLLFLHGDNSSTWTHYKAVARYDGAGGGQYEFRTSFSSGGEYYVDDVYVFSLDEVSLTVTSASEANSTESTGVRVDGLDTYTKTFSNLNTTGGSLSFDFTPRVDFDDADLFGVDQPVIVEAYGDADDYIRLYREDDSTLRLQGVFNGTTVNSDWSSPTLNGGTTYSMEIQYGTNNGNLTLTVNSTEQATASGVVTMGTAPSSGYFGSDNTGDNQYGGTFD